MTFCPREEFSKLNVLLFKNIEPGSNARYPNQHESDTIILYLRQIDYSITYLALLVPRVP